MNNNNGNNNNRNNNNGWAWAGAAAAGIAAAAGGIYWLTKSSGEAKPNDQRALTNQRASTSTSTNHSTRSMPPNTREAGRSDTGSLTLNLCNYLERISLPRDREATKLSHTHLMSAVPSGAELFPYPERPRWEVPKIPHNARPFWSQNGLPVNHESENPISFESGGIREVPDVPLITNLNSLLHDIYIRYIALKADDFQMHYNIFFKIFYTLHQTMKDVDPYYKKYSSTVQFAGSHFDRLRIKKPDEFDMDIIIGLPLNIRHDPFNAKESDFVIEPKSAGFLQLRMGTQFQRLHMRDGNEWEINKTAYEWKDSNNYLLRSKFLDWFKSVIIRALNTFEQDFQSRPTFVVDGITYNIRTSESGPAVTLIIENRLRGFHLDVDLVPALKFPEDRWPIGPSYREIPAECRKEAWMVVGKPNKAACDKVDALRSWRIALHNQERVLMHDSYNLRLAMKFLKKLRDEQGMHEIASYYIKTLFFWEIVERNDRQYWSSNNPATILKMMAQKFHEALVRGNIPYFWNKRNNLIANVSRSKLDIYAIKVAKFIDVLQQPILYKEVAKYLLSNQEYEEYKKFL